MPTTLNWGKRHFTCAKIQYLQNLFPWCVKSLFRCRPVCSFYQPDALVLTSDLYLMLIYYLWHSRYSYAIVGINLTEMAYSLLRTGALKPHFYNTVQGTPELKHFHQLYCEYLISMIFLCYLRFLQQRFYWTRKGDFFFFFFINTLLSFPPGYLAYEFDKFWVAEEPESIMHFNQYREKFHNIVKAHLEDPDVSLTLTVNSDKN